MSDADTATPRESLKAPQEEVSSGRLLKGLLMINSKLDQIIGRAHAPLGFDIRGGTKYLYVDNRGESLWAFLDGDNKAYPQLPALRCIIQGLAWTTSATYDPDDPKEKLLVDVIGAEPITLFAGLNTTFSRMLLQRLLVLERGDLEDDVTLVVKAGEKNTVLLDVFHRGRSVFSDNEKLKSVKPLLDEVSLKHFGHKPEFRKLRGSG